VILVADIGGTRARLGLAPLKGPLRIVRPEIRESSAFRGIKALLRDYLSGVPRPERGVLAVAGPVEGDEIDLTNCDWVVRPRKMMETMGFSDIIVINDFEAQALAVVALDDDNLEMVCPGTSQPTGSRVVLGPGTGLGMAGLVHAQHTWFPVPGEGGHVDLGPRTGRDLEIFPHLERIEGRVAAEQILCGRGMVNLYRAINAADGTKPVHETPAEISSAGLDGSDPVAMETLDLFVTYLGRLAGDMALIFMARGGVYLSGGIAQKIVPTLKNGHFRAAFEDKAPHSALVKDIPVYVITHPKAALVGLAAYARTPVRFGIETQGRRWKAA